MGKNLITTLLLTQSKNTGVLQMGARGRPQNRTCTERTPGKNVVEASMEGPQTLEWVEMNNS